MPLSAETASAAFPIPKVTDPAIGALCARFPERPEFLLPLLHAIQKEFGYIPAHGVGQIAASLNIARAEVHAVLQFYTYFRTTPPATLTIEICQAEACLAQQALPLTQHIEQSLGCRLGQSTSDGQIELKKVFCLGLCTHGPVLQINEKPYVRLSPEHFEQIIDTLLP